MAYSWKDLLSKRKAKDIEEAFGGESDTLEQLKARERMSLGEMTGGGYESERQVAGREFAETRQDIGEAYDIERSILQQQEDAAKDAAEKKKRERYTKLGVDAVVAAARGGAALLTGGASEASGAGSMASSLASGITSAAYGGEADFSNIDYDALSKMGGYFKKRKRFANAEYNITPGME